MVVTSAAHFEFVIDLDQILGRLLIVPLQLYQAFGNLQQVSST
jgi:hypothetical protein